MARTSHNLRPRKARRWLPRHDPNWVRDRAAEKAAVSVEHVPGLIVRRSEFPSADRQLVGQTLVFLSDLHWNQRTEQGSEALVAAINAENADWLVFGGDLARYLEYVPAATRVLRALEARRGKIAVLGNRETALYWLPPTFWRARYAEADFRLLVNTTWSDPQARTPLFAGLDDGRHGTPQAQCLLPEAGTEFRVLVAHSPDTVVEAGPEARVGNLVLAGHTHGGQIRVPLLGAVCTSSVYGRQFDRGWFKRRQDGTRLYVTSGSGETGIDPLRRRVLCPAEVMSVTLTLPPQQ